MRTAAAAGAVALWLCATGAAGQVYSALLPGFLCARQDVVCAALGDLYAATRGSQWRNSSGWATAAAGSAVEYCTFAFVTCNATGQVLKL